MSPTPLSLRTDLQWAPAPFDKPTADVILQSSDNVCFRVRKGILAEASSVFDDLFAHATPAPNASLRCGDEMIEGVPAIAMEETSSVLTFILHIYYPPYEVSHSLDTMDDAFGAMEAARKYMMPHAQKVVTKHFELFAETDAVRVYAVACSRRLPEEKRLAALATLNDRLNHCRMEELDRVTGNDYCNLLQYREDCVSAATRVVRLGIPLRWLNMKSWFRLEDNKGPSSIWCPLTISDRTKVLAPREFLQYLEAAVNSLRERPCPDAIYDRDLSSQLHRIMQKYSSYYVRAELVDFETELANAIREAVLKVDVEAL